jgi:lysyl-tRNA synthetase class II
VEEKKIQPTEIEHEDLNVLMVRRREELDQLTKLGINPFPYEFARDSFSSEIIATFKDDDAQRNVAIAGRIMSIRRMGRLRFAIFKILRAEFKPILRRMIWA